MKDHEMQETQIIEDGNDIDFFDDDDYEPAVWDNPDYAEFAGWRDLVL